MKTNKYISGKQLYLGETDNYISVKQLYFMKTDNYIWSKQTITSRETIISQENHYSSIQCTFNQCYGMYLYFFKETHLVTHPWWWLQHVAQWHCTNILLAVHWHVLYGAQMYNCCHCVVVHHWYGDNIFCVPLFSMFYSYSHINDTGAMGVLVSL